MRIQFLTGRAQIKLAALDRIPELAMCVRAMLACRAGHLRVSLLALGPHPAAGRHLRIGSVKARASPPLWGWRVTCYRANPTYALRSYVPAQLSKKLRSFRERLGCFSLR